VGFLSDFASGIRSGKIRGNAVSLIRQIIGEHAIPNEISAYLSDYTSNYPLSSSDVPEVAIMGLIRYHDLGTKGEGKGLLLQKIVNWLAFAEGQSTRVIPDFCRDMVLDRIREHNEWCLGEGLSLKDNLCKYLEKYEG